MIVWCIVLIILGVFGLLVDSGIVTGLGPPYDILTWVVMLIALGILVRIRYKEKAGEKEKMRALIEELERKLGEKQQEA